MSVRWSWAGLLLLLLAGAIARSYEYGRSLWLDEAWVANSVLTGTWEGLFFYPGWLQTSPPLFLVLQKFLGSWAGWRLPSWLFGMAAIVTAFALGRIVSGWRAGLVAASLVAGSKWAVQFSKDAKQYSAELFFGLLLLLAATAWPRIPMPWRWTLPLVAALAAGFSYPSLFYLPALLAVLCWRRDGKIALATAAAVATVVALIQIVLVSGNTHPILREVWTNFYWNGTLGFFPRAFAGAIGENLWPVIGPRAAPVIVLVLFAAGLWARRWEMGLVFSPFALAMCACLLGLYPFGFERFTFHLLAPIVLAAVLALSQLSERFQSAVAALAVIAVAAQSLVPSYWEPRFRDGTAAALEYLRSEKKLTPADLLYVHAVGLETFRYYQRELRWRGPEVIIGAAGPACCPRLADPKKQMLDPAVFRADFENYVARGAARRLWFLYTNFDAHWRAIQRQDEQEHARLLAARGCRREERREFSSVSLAAYWCPL